MPASHDSHNNRRRHQRFLPRDFHKDHRKPVRNDCDGGEEGTQEAEDQFEEEPVAAEGDAPPQLNFVPFCEDPAVARQRQADRRASQDAARNRKGNRGQRQPGNLPPPQPMPVNGFEVNGHGAGAPPANPEAATNGDRVDNYARGGARPKTFTNKSGKSWRHGTDDEARGSRGGKWKEDTNHGKAQDINFRRKMEHKNKSRKQAAQNKFERNN